MKLKNLLSSILLMFSIVLAGCVSDNVQIKEISQEQNQNNQIESEEIEVSETESSNITQKEDKVEDLDYSTPNFSNYKLIEVDTCDTSGYRQANVVVNIGYGDREYWAYTNEHGQLVRVTAKEIILQDDSKETGTSGRYCSKMADVPGVGASTGYDRGHVIADSLGGVANAYNITPQDATLNRHGDQAYMERNIREAGGATDFEAIITYPNNETQIPSKYKFTYTIKGNKVVDEFENGNPDKANEAAGLTGSKNQTTTQKPSTTPNTQVSIQEGDLASVDKNGDGKVTIKEAKDAGFAMPITKDHWLYQYMNDRDGDGVVGE